MAANSFKTYKAAEVLMLGGEPVRISSMVY